MLTFLTLEIDSVILSLNYDTVGQYGPYAADQGIEVYALDAMLDDDATYYSDAALTHGSNLLGSMQFKRLPVDSPRTSNDLRIPLDNALAETILQFDSIAFSGDSVFREHFPGISLLPTVWSSAMMNFDIIDSEVVLYFKEFKDNKQDTTLWAYQLLFGIGSAKVVTFQHDFSGSIVESAFNDQAQGDTILYIQNMAGPIAKIKIPGTDNFSDVIVNKAELEFWAPETDPILYPLIERLFLLVEEVDENGQRKLIRDLDIALNRSNVELFGGQAIYIRRRKSLQISPQLERSI